METLNRRAHSLRWSLRNKDGVTCYVYSQMLPDHLLSQGYTNLEPAGYYDHGLNVIVNPQDPASEVIDSRKAPGV